MRSGEVFMPGNSGRQDKKIFENATIKGLSTEQDGNGIYEINYYCYLGNTVISWYKAAILPAQDTSI